MQDDGLQDEYTWNDAHGCQNHAYLLPALLKDLARGPGKKVLDIGCGNGSLTSHLVEAGYAVTGIEQSLSGINAARKSYPHIDFRTHSVDDTLPSGLQGEFDQVVAAEVVEHLFMPRELFIRAAEALRPGGKLIVSTPYHGYLKNLALALTDSFDHHWRPSWDYGHIKFFSRKTLAEMSSECGFFRETFQRVGRVPPLAKTMVMAAELRPKIT